jgi:hypothetical protein
MGQGIRELGQERDLVQDRALDPESAADAAPAPVLGRARDAEPARVARPDVARH